MIKFLDIQKITAKYHDEIHQAIDEVVDSGWYLQGEANARFEKHFAEYIGTDCCVGCANGLDALIWIFRAYIEAGIMSPGDEVIVPPAGSCGVAKDRMEGVESGLHCYDWFFCTKQISKEEVESRLGKK